MLALAPEGEAVQPPHVPPVSPSAKTWLATGCCALGLALSLYLALLKFYALPCLGGGGCHTVIHSGYGSVFGLPVGLFGAVLWLGAILIPDTTKRAALIVLLAIGSAIFMGIQFFVLRSFCLYCTLHAATAWLALLVARHEKPRFALLAGVLLAGIGFLGTRAYTEARATPVAVQVPSGVPLAAAPSSVPWLGPLTPRSPALILSLNCAACLDLMEDLTRESYTSVNSGPAIFFKTNPENRELTTVFVASILAFKGGKRQAFLGSTALLMTLKDQALSSPQLAAAQLAAMVPGSAAQRQAAEQLLQAQAETLATQGVGDTTPLLVPIGAKPRAFFKTDDLFGR